MIHHLYINIIYIRNWSRILGDLTAIVGSFFCWQSMLLRPSMSWDVPENGEGCQKRSSGKRFVKWWNFINFHPNFFFWGWDAVDGSEILLSSVGSLSHYLHSFLHPRWLFWNSSINSINKKQSLVWFIGRGWDTALSWIPKKYWYIEAGLPPTKKGTIPPRQANYQHLSTGESDVEFLFSPWRLTRLFPRRYGQHLSQVPLLSCERCCGCGVHWACDSRCHDFVPQEGVETPKRWGDVAKNRRVDSNTYPLRRKWYVPITKIRRNTSTMVRVSNDCD